jgi:hypothetical protein
MNVKKYLSVIVFVISIIVSSSLFAEQGLMQIDKSKGLLSKDDLQKMYLEYLTTEGFKGEIDQDGDVRFKNEGLTYYISIDEKDQEFFRLVLPQVYEFDETKDLTKAIIACEYATGRTKVAKVSIVKNKVWVSAEMLLSAPDQFKTIFKRTLGVCQTARKIFMEKIRE